MLMILQMKKTMGNHVIVQKHIVCSYIAHAFTIVDNVQQNANAMIAIMMDNMKKKSLKQ
jgi:hypothetical protein